MKLLSLIFSIHVLFLTVAPSLPVVFRSTEKVSCKSSCCSKQKKKQKQDQSEQNKGCSNNGICNPFMSCCNCHTLISKLHFVPSLIYTDQIFEEITENPNSDFLSDAWHPPKIV